MISVLIFLILLCGCDALVSIWKNHFEIQQDVEKLQAGSNLLYFSHGSCSYNDNIAANIAKELNVSTRRCMELNSKKGFDRFLSKIDLSSPTLVVVKDSENPSKRKALDFTFRLTDSSTDLSNLIVLVSFHHTAETVQLLKTTQSDEFSEQTRWSAAISEYLNDDAIYFNGRAFIGRMTRIVFDSVENAVTNEKCACQYRCIGCNRDLEYDVRFLAAGAFLTVMAFVVILGSCTHQASPKVKAQPEGKNTSITAGGGGGSAGGSPDSSPKGTVKRSSSVSSIPALILSDVSLHNNEDAATLHVTPLVKPRTSSSPPIHTVIGGADPNGSGSPRAARSGSQEPPPLCTVDEPLTQYSPSRGGRKKGGALSGSADKGGKDGSVPSSAVKASRSRGASGAANTPGSSSTPKPRRSKKEIANLSADVAEEGGPLRSLSNDSAESGPFSVPTPSHTHNTRQRKVTATPQK